MKIANYLCLTVLFISYVILVLTMMGKKKLQRVLPLLSVFFFRLKIIGVLYSYTVYDMKRFKKNFLLKILRSILERRCNKFEIILIIYLIENVTVTCSQDTNEATKLFSSVRGSQASKQSSKTI